MLLAGPISHSSTQYIDFVDFLYFTGFVYHLFCSFSWVLSFLCVWLSFYPRMLCYVFWSQVVLCFLRSLPVLSLQTSVCSTLKFCPVFSGVILSIRSFFLLSMGSFVLLLIA